MPGKGVMAEIKGLLTEGKSKKDLIALGYARGSVYSAARRLAKEGSKPKSSNPRRADIAAGGLRPEPASTPTATSHSEDAGIASLQRQIQIARLEAELAQVRGDGVSLEAIREEVHRLEDWVVSNISDIGQCLVRMRGEEVDTEAFGDFERESLDELRTP